MCGVIGRVDAGKSTLIQVILGELQLDDGFVHINGRISYASQAPCLLLQQSIKENIVLLEAFDQER